MGPFPQLSEVFVSTKPLPPSHPIMNSSCVSLAGLHTAGGEEGGLGLVVSFLV